MFVAGPSGGRSGDGNRELAPSLSLSNFLVTFTGTHGTTDPVPLSTMTSSAPAASRVAGAADGTTTHFPCGAPYACLIKNACS